MLIDNVLLWKSMNVSTQSHVSGFHLAESMRLYSRRALAVKSLSRLFLLRVAKVCSRIALFISPTYYRVGEKALNKPKFLPMDESTGFLSAVEM